MAYDPKIHHRRSIRLQGYEYSQAGAYFVTICAHNRECLFGEIVAGDMRLNALGKIAVQCWLEIPDHFPCVELDVFVVMPNHIHGILMINDNAQFGVGANDRSPVQQLFNVGGANIVRANDYSPLQHAPQSSPHRTSGTSKTIGSMVRGFKIGVTKWARANTQIHTVWQRNYYEHIIRNDADLARIREYIVNNPAQWESDSLHPSQPIPKRMRPGKTS